MMGQRQVDQAALFYEFSLERHVPAALCVPKTSNPTIVVMKSAQDGA
jgi:hypothetical protein